MKESYQYHVMTKNGHQIPVRIKQYAYSEIILKKIQYAIEHIEPQRELHQIIEICHFGGCSNHACEIRLSNDRSIFLRVPGDHPQILDDRDPKRTESVFVNRAIEYPTQCVINTLQVNGELDSEAHRRPDFYFCEKDIYAGYKIEPFIPGCQTLENLFNDDHIRRSALKVLSRLHTEDVLNTWKSSLMSDEQWIEYDIVLRIKMMLEGMDAIDDNRDIQEKLVKNPFRVINGVDIYAEGRTGVHISTSQTGLIYTVLPKREEIKTILDMYDALRRFLRVDVEECVKRLCHNDLSPANYLVSKKKIGCVQELTDRDIVMIDFEFAAINDPICDLAYLISEEKTLLSEQNVLHILQEYHDGEEICSTQFENELDRLAFYLPLIDLKVAIWSSYQVLLHNESSSLKGLTQTWGVGRWNSFIQTLNHPWVRSRFEKNHVLVQLDSVLDFAMNCSKTVRLSANQKNSLFKEGTTFSEEGDENLGKCP